MPAEIPDRNLFMICRKLNTAALSDLPEGFGIRPLRRDELDIWKAIHFDDPVQAIEYRDYMGEYFINTYATQEDLFYRTCYFVCDADDTPVGTCFAWKVYGGITTIHWYKVIRSHEGRGIGRALLSYVMRQLVQDDYPVYLHTQPSSYRAIKLYTDFGFALLTDSVIGYRENHLKECLPVLKEYMLPSAYASLKYEQAPQKFLDATKTSRINKF